MNYYDHHLGDYAKDTAHLSMLEHGAYRLLLDRYYATEAPIPENQAYRLARARTEDEKEAVDIVLNEFFSLKNGLWHNKRADEEIIKTTGKIIAAKENGKRGGRPKKETVGYENETQIKPSGLSVGYENETQVKAKQKLTSTQYPVPNVNPLSEKSSVVKNSPAPEKIPETQNATQLENCGKPLPDAPDKTRKGALCQRLRTIGIEAAPHLAAWEELLSGYSDDEILSVAEAKKALKPNDRLHLNYLLVALRDRAPPKNSAQGASLKPIKTTGANHDAYDAVERI